MEAGNKPPRTTPCFNAPIYQEPPSLCRNHRTMLFVLCSAIHLLTIILFTKHVNGLLAPVPSTSLFTSSPSLCQRPAYQLLSVKHGGRHEAAAAEEKEARNVHLVSGNTSEGAPPFLLYLPSLTADKIS